MTYDKLRSKFQLAMAVLCTAYLYLSVDCAKLTSDAGAQTSETIFTTLPKNGELILANAENTVSKDKTSRTVLNPSSSPEHAPRNHHGNIGSTKMHAPFVQDAVTTNRESHFSTEKTTRGHSVGLGSTCTSDAECQSKTSNSECKSENIWGTSSTCQCVYGYAEVDSKCIFKGSSGTGISYIVIPVIGVVLIFFFVCCCCRYKNYYQSSAPSTVHVISRPAIRAPQPVWSRPAQPNGMPLTIMPPPTTPYRTEDMPPCYDQVHNFMIYPPPQYTSDPQRLNDQVPPQFTNPSHGQNTTADGQRLMTQPTGNPTFTSGGHINQAFNNS